MRRHLDEFLVAWRRRPTVPRRSPEPGSTTSWRAPVLPSMMVTVLVPAGVRPPDLPACRGAARGPSRRTVVPVGTAVRAGPPAASRGTGVSDVAAAVAGLRMRSARRPSARRQMDRRPMTAHSTNTPKEERERPGNDLRYRDADRAPAPPLLLAERGAQVIRRHRPFPREFIATRIMPGSLSRRANSRPHAASGAPARRAPPGVVAAPVQRFWPLAARQLLRNLHAIRGAKKFGAALAAPSPVLNPPRERGGLGWSSLNSVRRPSDSAGRRRWSPFRAEDRAPS